jgi:type IV pilus assembly protein PilP
VSTVKKIIRLITVGLIACLAACVSSNMSDLKAYVEKVKERPGQGVEPLPEVKPYKPFLYSASDVRSPPVPTRQAGGGINGPDLNRPKEALEAYPLDSLRMVGTLSQGGVQWALIKDKSGTLHHVKVSNYIGQNYGRVTKITEDKVYITEMLPDNTGGSWQEHPTTIAISDQP